MMYVWICLQVKYQLYSVLAPILLVLCTYSRAHTEPSVSENIKAAPLDSADCPALSDKVRTELVSRANGQIKPDFIFPKRGLGRMPPP